MEIFKVPWSLPNRQILPSWMGWWCESHSLVGIEPACKITPSRALLGFTPLRDHSKSSQKHRKMNNIYCKKPLLGRGFRKNRVCFFGYAWVWELKSWDRTSFISSGRDGRGFAKTEYGFLDMHRSESWSLEAELSFISSGRERVFEWN